MRNIKSTDRFKIWEINDKDGYAEIRMSESRKIKEDNSYDALQVQNGVAQNGYIGTNWYFVRFTGHAYNKLKEVSVGETITNLSMDISKEPYYGDTNIEINKAIDLLEKNNIIVQGGIPKLPRKDGVVYPTNVRITVFSFNTLDEAKNEEGVNVGQTKNMDRAPKVAQTAPVMPQQPQYTPVQPTTTIVQPQAPIQPIPVAPTAVEASDNCPF